MSTFLKSANFNGTNGSHFHIELYYTVTDQNQANNTSTINYDLWFVSSDGYSGSGATYNGYINGGWVGNGTSIGVNASKYIGSKSVTVTHNEDGTKNVSYSASLNTPWSLGSASLSGELTLPKIDRYAYITDTVQNPNDESTIWFKYNNPLNLEMRPWLEVNPTGTHYATRTITDGGTSGTYEWTLTTQERNQLRSALANANNGTLRIGIHSTINNVEGSSYRDVPFSIVNANPDIGTPTYTETNTKVSDLLGTATTTVVQNASIVNIAVSPTALKQASITKVEVTHNNVSYTDTTSPYSFSIPITTNNLNIKVTDSRGNINNNSAGLTKTWSGSNYIEYQPVNITNLSMKRVNPTSSNIVLNLEATYYQKTFGSTANVPIVKWKLDNGNYTTIPSNAYTIDTTNNKLTISNYTLSNALIYTSNGTFTISIEDLLTSDTDTRDVIKGIPTFDAGEHDLKVNGKIYLADQDGQNPVEVLAGGVVGYDLYSGTTKFGNNVMTISSDYKYVDVYVQYIYSNNNQGNTVIRVDTSSTPSANQVVGALVPLGDTIFVEIELIFTTGRILKADWIGHYNAFNSSSATSHQNNNSYYVYKVIGYKEV